MERRRSRFHQDGGGSGVKGLPKKKRKIHHQQYEIIGGYCTVMQCNAVLVQS